MKTKISIHKVQFKNQLVDAVLSTNKQLTFKHFNNRRYYFNYENDDDLLITIELRVHLNAKRLVLTVNAVSILDEAIPQRELDYRYDKFMDRKTSQYFTIDPENEVLIRDKAVEIHIKIKEAIKRQRGEMLLSRLGISIGMQYPFVNEKVEIEFPQAYSSRIINDSKNEQFKAFYIHLFKKLDMANNGIPDYRIRYVLLAIMQTVFVNKGIPFTNPIY